MILAFGGRFDGFGECFDGFGECFDGFGECFSTLWVAGKSNSESTLDETSVHEGKTVNASFKIAGMSSWTKKAGQLYGVGF